MPREARTVTIQQVARTAGVAASTVSRVLNGGYASAEVEQRVRATMKQLGYSPSTTARNLKRGRTGILGLVAETSQAPWFSLFLSGVESALRDHDSSVALCSLELDGQYSAAPVHRWLDERRVDCLLLVRPTERERPLVAAARRVGVPQLHIVPDLHFEGVATIAADNASGGQTAARHLLDLGHEQFAFCGPSPQSADSNARLLGVRQALAERGLELPEHRVLYGRDYSHASGALAGRRFLTTPSFQPVTAVILASDALALGFMGHLRKQGGPRVPEQLSVCGFDDVPAAELVYPSLTTIGQPIEQMGRDAAHALLAGSEKLPGEMLYPTHLVRRESTAKSPHGPTASDRQGGPLALSASEGGPTPNDTLGVKS